MQILGKFMLLFSMWALVQCSPFDDGKYKKKVYNIYDDGKYYRPPTEGKYVPTDEGKYRYIYQRGVYPFDGTYKHLERGDSNDYIGYQIYAPRFPFIHSVIKALIKKYISPDIIVVAEALEGSANSLNNVQAENEVAMKCKVIESDTKNETEVVKEFPPRLNLKEGEELGTVYNFRGSKVLSSGEGTLKKKVKLEYEVFVRVVEEVDDDDDDDDKDVDVTE